MSSNESYSIGRVDLKNDIVKFLKAHNTSSSVAKKISTKALARLDIFVNVVMKVLVVNCAEMLRSLKVVTLTDKILHIVYDITINGDGDFTTKSYDQFDNVLFREQVAKSKLTYNAENGVVLNTNIFDLSSLKFVWTVVKLMKFRIIVKMNKFGLLIEFILARIFDSCGDCGVITTQVLERVAHQEEFVKLDEYLGSFGILSNDTIE